VKKLYLAIVALLVLSLVVVGCPKPAAAPAPAPSPAPVKPIVWRVNCNYVSEGVVGDALRWFKQDLEQRSGGRMTVELYFVGALGYKGTEGFSVVKEGLVEINEIVGTTAMGEVPLTAIPSMPFLFETPDDLIYWQEKVFFPIFNEDLKKWDCQVLSSTPRWAPIYFFSKEPLRTPEDFKGKTVRTWGGINDDALAAIGMHPFVVPTAEIYTALQRGMIETAITSYMSASECKFWEVLEYVDVTPLYHYMQWNVVSLSALNALPTDLQEIVMLCGQDLTNWYAYMGHVWPKRNLKMLLDGGMEIVYPDAGTVDELARLVKPVYQRYAEEAGPVASKLMRDLGAID